MATEYACDLLFPSSFSRTAIDPAPPASESSSLQITAPSSSSGATASAALAAVAPSVPEVLQQFEFEFVFSVPRLSASTTDKTLSFPLKSIFEAGTDHIVPGLNLWIHQPCYPQNPRVLRGYTWEIWFETSKLEMVQADDDGPAFSTAALTQVTVCPATLLQNGGFSYKRSTHFWVQKVRRPEDSGLTIYEVLSVDTTHVAVICKFVFSRRFSRIEWNVLTCGTLPPLKYSLLDSAARTGDVILLGGVSLSSDVQSAYEIRVILGSRGNRSPNAEMQK